jgi:multidrug resistance efflux pump
LRAAKLNCHCYPFDGQVQNFSRTINNQGQSYFILSIIKKLIANFKETQLNKMVLVKSNCKVDAILVTQGSILHFHRTGSRFSLLPPDNARKFCKTIKDYRCK